MRVHFQNFDSGNNIAAKTIDDICTKHPKCENCKLKTEDLRLEDGSILQCITGRMKKE